MRRCRWCKRDGDWPKICLSTRDMEEKTYDPICNTALLNVGGGERIENQERARQQGKQTS